jgi:hypothetical protein
LVGIDQRNSFAQRKVLSAEKMAKSFRAISVQSGQEYFGLKIDTLSTEMKRNEHSLQIAFYAFGGTKFSYVALDSIVISYERSLSSAAKPSIQI